MGELTAGKVQLQSATALAFGPDGILFVADSMGGAVVALDTNDRARLTRAVKIDVQGVDAKIASLVGTTPDQIMVNDLAVNPVEECLPRGFSRTRPRCGTGDRERGCYRQDVASFARQHQELRGRLTDAPESNPTARQDPRSQTVTDMDFTNGKLYRLRAVQRRVGIDIARHPVPVQVVEAARTFRSGMHRTDDLRPRLPVRTFVPYTIAGQPYILAAYTCTPLVKIPLSDLKAGAQIKPVTIADVGSGNQPLDMVPYKKDGHEFILISNSNRGVMKMSADNIGTYKAVESPEQPNPPAYIFGMPYETVGDLKGVTQLAQVDAANAMILSKSADAQNLTTIALP